MRRAFVYVPGGALLLLVLLAAPALAGSLTFYLHADGRTASTTLGEEPDDVEVEEDEPVTWNATAALVSVDLSGAWTVSLRVEEGEGPRKFDVRLGKLVGARFVSVAEVALEWRNCLARPCVAPMATEGFQFLPGERLAFQIAARGEGEVEILADHPDTWFLTPTNAPGYPTPELSPVVLVAGGLVLLALRPARRRA